MNQSASPVESYPDLQAAEEVGQRSLARDLSTLADGLLAARDDDALILAAVFRWFAVWGNLDSTAPLQAVLSELNRVRGGGAVGLKFERRALSSAEAMLERITWLTSHLSCRLGPAWAVVRDALRAVGEDDVYFALASRGDAMWGMLGNSPTLSVKVRDAMDRGLRTQAALNTEPVNQVLQALNPRELAGAINLMLTALDCDAYERLLRFEMTLAAQRRGEQEQDAPTHQGMPPGPNASPAGNEGLVRSCVAAFEPAARAQLREDGAEAIRTKGGGSPEQRDEGPGSEPPPWRDEDLDGLQPQVRKLIRFMWARRCCQLDDLAPTVWRDPPNDSQVKLAQTKANRFLVSYRYTLSRPRGETLIRLDPA